ncbi:hypothetical protein CLF_107922 [Clonorchis sinensis]|uniref:Uncharacterized protein n=1 Tax=Clonorchis sinensis TaxID=79923 RepID=G7YHC4_CLOSI|nr:hypothetical protein CLF_107922 [Clonorchis sinensis]
MVIDFANCETLAQTFVVAEKHLDVRCGGWTLTRCDGLSTFEPPSYNEELHFEPHSVSRTSFVTGWGLGPLAAHFWPLQLDMLGSVLSRRTKASEYPLTIASMRFVRQILPSNFNRYRSILNQTLHFDIPECRIYASLKVPYREPQQKVLVLYGCETRSLWTGGVKRLQVFYQKRCWHRRILDEKGYPASNLPAIMGRKILAFRFSHFDIPSQDSGFLQEIGHWENLHVRIRSSPGERALSETTQI